MRRKYIVANWKMNPLDVAHAKKLFDAIKRRVSKFTNVKIVICPPHVFLSELTYSYSGDKIEFGAQDSFWQSKGSFTGENSPVQIKDLGAEYVILGHSERRSMGETNKIINNKIKAALDAGLNIILCVGEKERDEEGEYLHFIKEELSESLKKIKRTFLRRLIVAYEPIWAIDGSEDDAMTPRELHQMKLFVQKSLKEIFGQSGMDIPILYGGSSSPGNAEELIKDGQVNGLLVGHESLKQESFLEIIKIANSLK